MTGLESRIISALKQQGQRGRNPILRTLRGSRSPQQRAPRPNPPVELELEVIYQLESEQVRSKVVICLIQCRGKVKEFVYNFKDLKKVFLSQK